MENLDLSIDTYSKLVKWLESELVRNSFPQVEPLTHIAIDKIIREYVVKHKIPRRKPSFELQFKNLLLNKYNAKSEFTYCVDGAFLTILLNEMGNVIQILVSKGRIDSIKYWCKEIESGTHLSIPINLDLIKMIFYQKERILNYRVNAAKKRLLKKSLLLKSRLSNFKEIFLEICPDFYVEIDSTDGRGRIKIKNASSTMTCIINDGDQFNSLIADPNAIRDVSIWIATFENLPQRPIHLYRNLTLYV